MPPVIPMQVTPEMLLEIKSLKKKTGIVYTILQRDFTDHVLRKEEDINADATNINASFKKLGFDVEKPLINETKEDIISYLTRVYNSDTLKEYECVFVFFVSHFSEPGKLLCRGGQVCDEEIINIMKGEKHSDLLKIFIFQASKATLKESKVQTDASAFCLSIPDEANFFVIKSSFEHKLSPFEHGSFFLKVFCKNMEKIGNDASLFDVMAAVLRELKVYRSRDDKIRQNNILPEVTSTLLKTIRFQPAGKTSLVSSCYKEKQSIGKLIVFNYYYTAEYSECDEPRPGSEHDVEAIKTSFPSIGFKVEVNIDLQASGVRKTLNEGSRCKEGSCQGTAQCGLRHEGDPPADYSNDTCVAVAIMGHGQSHHLQTTREEMSISDIISRLITKEDCFEEREDLSGKPKLFVIQVCRTSSNSESKTINVPLKFEDTLVFHSSYHGHDSNRETETGSWFIQKLCEVIDDIPDENPILLIDLLKKVQQIFVSEYGTKQMPVIYSTLSENLYIKKISSVEQS